MFDGYDRGVTTPEEFNVNINVEIKRIFALNILQLHSYTEL